MTDRRRFLAYFGSVGLGGTLLPGVLWGRMQSSGAETLTLAMLKDAADVAGLRFSSEELQQMLEGVASTRERLGNLRAIPLDNGVVPPVRFDPLLPGRTIDVADGGFQPSPPGEVERPADLEKVAFWPVTRLAELVRTKRVRSVELTEMYLARLKKFDPLLKCVVTRTDDLAMRQARAADDEIQAGRYRGPLHGIPWGAKDIIAARGYPTTWGAAPFESRVLDVDATVVEKLAAAGAVLVAKLSTGELALDDVWFGGRTNNPWDLEMGSQGSSAGPASATAAGLVGFSIGSETGGSIVEPSGICGVTGLRPTFGRVSRYGVMSLSWSLDKVGPICRSVEDCALVLDVIQGADGRDATARDVPLRFDGAGASGAVKRLRIGYLASAFRDTRQTPAVDANDAAALAALVVLGIDLLPVELPEGPTPDLASIIWAEGAAQLRDPLETESVMLKRQDRVVWNRSAHLIPAVDYLHSQRLRTRLMEAMDELMRGVDVYVVPFDYADYTPNPVATRNTQVTNLTGHPSVTLPSGFNEKGNPTSVTFIGKLYGEGAMLAVAKAYQDATGWHLRHPPRFS
jgi:Asp-tRNA(Asn)/Glu-tRNA(Gln) amidotransferase A subunit family amidase